MHRISVWITFWFFFSSVFCVCLADETCYPAGGVAGIVVATIIVTAIVTVLIIILGWKVWKRKRVRKKQPEPPRREAARKSSGDFAFDNPYFRDQEEDDPDSVQKGKNRTSLNNKTPLRSSKQGDHVGNKGKKGKSPKGHNFIFGGGVGGVRKQRTMDDTYLAAEPERTIVALKGHDFTGLGFNICGNMRDGILVKDVLHRGPASESGMIKAGDRIISVTVSFANIVYEDALTILSYASPYDVQLELERTRDKSNNLEETPNTAKRLGSGSFSNPGPKLFHPLYRSQSIDDLTQIDRDTFPSHGFGPRRSQSVGVAAHKLAAHFKNSDTRLEEKDRPTASAILSTTGSLNEKMLANVMADGGLHKNGLQWEKRFEDNLDDDLVESDPSKKAQLPDRNQKISSSSMEEERTSNNSDDRLDSYKKIFRGSNKRSSKQQKDKLTESSDAGNEVRTTAQIHEQSGENTTEKCKSMSDASKAVWHLDQTILDADSDPDSSRSYPWNRDKNPNQKNSNSRSKNHESKGNLVAGEESDVSGDSLECERQRRKKKSRPKTPSIDEVSCHVNDTDDYGGSKSMDCDKTRAQISGNFQSEQRTSKKSRKTPDNPHREQNCSLDTHNKRENVRCEDKYSCDMPLTRPPNHCSGPVPTQAYNKDKRMERVVLNPPHSPTLVLNSQHSKPDGYPVRNESPYSKTHNFQHNSPYSSANSSESGRIVERTYHGERQDPSINLRSSGHKYLPNNVNSVCENPAGNRGRFTPHQYQQRPQQCVEYQKPHVVDQQHPQRYDDEIRRVEPPRNGPPSYYQALRKANPAGMFTQINPFQQPNRQRNNFSAKPWVGKDMPVNGSSEGHYSMGYNKPVQVTTSDSSGRPRSRMEPPPYPQKMPDIGHSKTVLISTFDNANNNNNNPAVNFRHVRK